MNAHYNPANGLGRVRNGELIAAVIVNEWNGQNAHMHVTSTDARWCSKGFLKVIFDYVFGQLKAKRVTAPISAGNTPARRLVEKLGFKQEFIMLDGAADDDLILYVMRPEFCRWR